VTVGRSARAGPLALIGEQRADLGFIEDVAAGDVTFGLVQPLLASGSASSSRVASIDSRSSAASRTT